MMKYATRILLVFCMMLLSACNQQVPDQKQELKPAADERGIETTLIESEISPMPIVEGGPAGVAELGSEKKDIPSMSPDPEYAGKVPPPPIKNRPDQDVRTETAPKQTPNYPSAGKTWEKHFVSADSEIPINSFRAFYFNDKKPTEVLHTEVVDHPALNYSYEAFHGIDSYDFGAYYVGYFDFSAPAKRMINVDLSWADCRIIIDGKLVYATEKAPDVSAPGVYSYDSSGSMLYEFSPGKHKIEIEYVNNWHTVGYSIDFFEPYQITTQDELAAELKKTPDAEYWYAGVYESDDVGNDIQITLKPSQKPVFLFLSSFNAVDWILSDTNETNLKAVVLPSGRSAGTVAGLPENVTVYHLDDMPWAYQMLPDCSMGSCDDSGFASLLPFVLKLKPYFFTGFSMAYGAEEMMIPEEVFDLQDYERISIELMELIKKTKEDDPFDDRTADVF